ncbi:MAG TPA: Uma2 family endonuclease [Bryobacteraceae bacterium]
MVGTLISVDEYLHTMYDPDCDYVDGEVLERNFGDRKHSTTQGEFLFFFRSRQREWNVFTFPEQRIQVLPTRFRVPDVCVYVGEEPKEDIFRQPPFLCIEILSPEDRMERIQEKIDDYLDFGIPYVWVINPRTRRAWTYTKEEIREARDGVLRTENPAFAVPLAEIFTALDRS